MVHCWITPAGLELLAELDPVADEADDRLADSFEPAELRQLIALLERVRRQL